MSEEVTLYYFPPSFYSQKARLFLLEKGVKFQEKIIDLSKEENLSEEYMRLNPQGQVPLLKHGEKLVPDSEAIYRYGEEHFLDNSLLPKEKRDEVLRVHKEIHAIRVPLLTFGTILSDKYQEHTKMPKVLIQHARSKVTDPNAWEKVKQLREKAPEDLAPFYKEKLADYQERSKSWKDSNELEKELGTVEELLKRLEDRLAKAKEALQRAGSNCATTFLFENKPTIADIDLVVLLVRLNRLGHEQRLFNPETTPNLHRFWQQFERRPSYQTAVEKVYAGSEEPK